MDGIRRKNRKNQHKNIEHVKYNYLKKVEGVKMFLWGLADYRLRRTDQRFVENWIIDY